jgi:hypothetical protein
VHQEKPSKWTKGRKISLIRMCSDDSFGGFVRQRQLFEGWIRRWRRGFIYVCR